MFKVGDRVKFVNDTSVGYVSKVSKDIIEVDVEDGFTIPCSLGDLVAVPEEEEIEAIQKIGVGDERPGKKGKGAAKVKKDDKKLSVREPAYARYGKVSIIDQIKGDDEDEDDDDDFDDSYLDLNKIRDQYLRNKAAAEQREREFEEIRKRAEEEKKRVTEASPSATPSNDVNKIEESAQTKKGMESVTIEKLAEKMKVDIEKPQIVKPKKDSDIEVIDLHASEVLESTEGMKPGEILAAQLARFCLVLDLAVKSTKHGKIVFIHGVGSGKLKYEMQKLLKSKYNKLSSQDASFREYGYGAILVIY